jgi:hypothetical protein
LTLDEMTIQMMAIPDDLKPEIAMMIRRWSSVIGLAETKHQLDLLTRAEEISIRVRSRALR